MARLGGLSSETFSPSAGLGSILREQKIIPGVRSSRASVILGIAQPPVKQSVSVSSSPVESFLLDMDVGADEADELKEEDIWGMEDPTDGTGPDFGKRRLNSADELGGLGIGSPRVNTQEFLVSSRRREKGYGITDAFVNNGPMALSPLSRTSESGRGRIPRRPSASRMIPLSGGAGKDSSRRHAEGQSAPVEVPKWSKLMGQYMCFKAYHECRVWATCTSLQASLCFWHNRKNFGSRNEDCMDDNDEDDERLPPHELLARESARSQRSTFSVCEGLGRTLKGRDLSRVRNAVWSQMGFAD